jgi:hypothetical protein
MHVTPQIGLEVWVSTEGKGKGYPVTGHQRPRGGVDVQLYSFSTSALGGVGGQQHAPAALPPGKTRYPLYRGLGGRVRKISPPTGIRSPDRPARSRSLYQLSYPAHSLQMDRELFIFAPYLPKFSHKNLQF